MRLAARLKLGFYPAPAEAIALAASRLRAPAGPFALLDPCAGEGAAVRQLAQVLGCQPGNVFAVELEEGRAETLRANLPESKVLAPASAFGCSASWGSFGLIWLNSPFDHHYGGGRTEADWLQHITPWLAPGGVLVLICPEHTVDSEYDSVPYYLRQWYDCVTILPFPAECRRFGEVVVLAVKREQPYEGNGWDPRAPWQSIQAPEGCVYEIPSGPPPRVFAKVEPTETELERALVASPLRQRLNPPKARRLPSPPLALGTGHVALLLASGHLDGVVAPPGESGHLVRGTSRKRQVVANVETIVNDEGVETTKTTYTEKIELIVRAVDTTGNIRTFKEASEHDGKAA